MSMQIAQKIPFRPSQCPECTNYVQAVHKCRGYSVESWPRPLLAVLGDENMEPCPRFITGFNPEFPIPVAPPPVESTSATPPPVEFATLTSPDSTPAPMVATDAAEFAPVEANAETPVKVEPSQVSATENAEVNTPPPVRGVPRIHCHRCKAENPSSVERCQQCDAKLLPAEGVRARLTTFFSALIAAGFLGYLLYYFYIQNPGSAPDIPFLNPVVLGIATFLALITALTAPLRRTPEYVKYLNRANRHILLNPWQSLDDLDHAMYVAPEKEQGKLLKQRAKLYEKVGFAEDAARDFLVLATSPNAVKGEADFIHMFTGIDSDAYQVGRRSGQIATILEFGKAKAVGYCSQCNLVVGLDKEQRCLIHPKTKGREVEVVIPADLLAGKLAVMQKVEAGKPRVAEQLSALLTSGKASALGYCRSCRAVVELDPQRRCTIHPRNRIKNIQYAVPRDLASARRRIFKTKQLRQAGRNQTILIAGALIISVVLLLNAYDVDVAGFFQRLINSLR